MMRLRPGRSDPAMVCVDGGWYKGKWLVLLIVLLVKIVRAGSRIASSYRMSRVLGSATNLFSSFDFSPTSCEVSYHQGASVTLHTCAMPSLETAGRDFRAGIDNAG